jgi:hypothetical protein
LSYIPLAFMGESIGRTGATCTAGKGYQDVVDECSPDDPLLILIPTLIGIADRSS